MLCWPLATFVGKIVRGLLEVQAESALYEEWKLKQAKKYTQFDPAPRVNSDTKI